MRAVVIAQPTKRKLSEPSPAWRLYTGSQQRLVQEGLSLVWERFGHRQVIDEVLLSPLRGPLHPDRVIEPYDFTWKGRPRAEVERFVRETQVVERLQEAVAPYDLVLVLLSRTYLRPLRLAEWVPATAPQRWLCFASGEGLPFLPASTNVRVVPAGTAEARRAHVKVLDLKAHLFRNLCRRVASEGAGALESAWAAGEEIGD